MNYRLGDAELMPARAGDAVHVVQEALGESIELVFR
jgi:hypothetical protein